MCTWFQHVPTHTRERKSDPNQERSILDDRERSVKRPFSPIIYDELKSAESRKCLMDQARRFISWAQSSLAG